MRINLELDTNGFEIGDMVEFRPHCGRKKTLAGRVSGFRLPHTLQTFTGGGADRPVQAMLVVEVKGAADPNDDGAHDTGSWLDEPFLKRIPRADGK